MPFHFLADSDQLTSYLRSHLSEQDQMQEYAYAWIHILTNQVHSNFLSIQGKAHLSNHSILC